MFFKLFKKKDIKKAQDLATNSSEIENKNIEPIKRYSPEEQQELQIKRKRLVIKEFGKSLINLQLEHGIYTPLHIVDIYETSLLKNTDIAQVIQDGVKDSDEIHKSNLRQSIYRKSFYFQPSELLMVLKNDQGESVLSLKYLRKNLNKLIEYLKDGTYPILSHRLLLVRYFIPPIPDDLYKYENIQIPPKFEEVVRDIVNYCDLNYNAKNLTFEKWENLLNGLNAFGMIMKFPDSDEKGKITDLLTNDYSHLGYHCVKVEEIVKDTVEKNPVVLPLFIIVLAFFCSDKSKQSRFPYNLLFTPTGDQKEILMDKNDFSFFNLFNKLLDESLLPNQFRKCLATIYYEAFMLNQPEIDDLFFLFREEYRKKYLQEYRKSEGEYDYSSFYTGEDE